MIINYSILKRSAIPAVAILLATVPACKKDTARDAHAGHASHEGHDHTGHDSHDETTHPPAISEQALKNMGIEIKEVESSTFTVFEPVPAIVRETSANERPLYAPFSGRVKTINVDLGEAIVAGHVVLTLLRDPIPRLTLNQIDVLLKPVSDEFHNTISDLRKAHVELGIATKELARLEAINKEGDGTSLIPQKTIIDLRYDTEKFRQELDNLRGKLALHGFSKAEAKDIEAGKDIVISRNLWLSALKQNGIWDKTAEALFQILPKELQSNQWAIATIGELNAEGLLSDPLLSWLRAEPRAAESIIEIGSFLQQGNSLAAVKDLYNLGAFNPVIVVKAPSCDAGWDVEKIHIKVGQYVETGDELVTLSDHSRMFLMATPVGSEMAAINHAATNNLAITAIPLTKGIGPTLDGLNITKILGSDQEGSQAILPVSNTILSKKTVGNKHFRNWSLRNKFRYILKVPVRTLEDVIVLPSSAIVEKGLDKVILVQGEHGFEERRVVVVYQDDSVAAIGEGSEVFPEEPMVVRGAFPLSLALRAGNPEDATNDPHAGHDH